MYSVYGIGTILYGYAEINKNDHSYIATKWFTISYLPIIPLGSYRVWYGLTESTFSFFSFGSKTYLRLIKLKLNWKQVIKAYLVSLPFYIVIVWLILMISKTSI